MVRGEASSAITQEDVGVENPFLPPAGKAASFPDRCPRFRQEVQSQGPNTASLGSSKPCALQPYQVPHSLVLLWRFPPSPHLVAAPHRNGEDDPSKDAQRQSLVPEPSLSSFSAGKEGCLQLQPSTPRKSSRAEGCINKARDSLTAPIRGRVLSHGTGCARPPGRWPSGRERGRGAPPASRSSGAGPLRRPLLQPRRRPAPC